MILLAAIYEYTKARKGKKERKKEKENHMTSPLIHHVITKESQAHMYKASSAPTYVQMAGSETAVR
jgi:hypothetical protein